MNPGPPWLFPETPRGPLSAPGSDPISHLGVGWGRPAKRSAAVVNLLKQLEVGFGNNVNVLTHVAQGLRSICKGRKKKGAPSGAPGFQPQINSGLRHFNQLDLAVLAALQHVDPALVIVKDEDIAIAEFAFLDH